MTGRRIPLLAPSILTADFGSMAAEVGSVAGLVDWFHLDVMDGHYVPNLTFGPAMVEAIAAAVENPLHVHLMITDPARYARMFAEAGADRISFHPEVVEDVPAVIDHIRSLGAGPGIAVHPDTALESVAGYVSDIDVLLMMTVRPGFGGQSFLHEVIPKLHRARKLLDESEASADMEVDGGVKIDTVAEVVAAGSDIIVAGSAIFDGTDAPAAVGRLRERIDEARTRGHEPA